MVTALASVALPTIDSCNVNVIEPALACVVTALDVIDVTPVALRLYTLKLATKSPASASFDLMKSELIAKLVPPPTLSRVAKAA